MNTQTKSTKVRPSAVRVLVAALGILTLSANSAPVEDQCECKLLHAEAVIDPESPMQPCSFTGTIQYDFSEAYNGHCMSLDCYGPPSNCNMLVTVTVSGSSNCWIVMKNGPVVFGRGLLGSGSPPLMTFQASTKLNLECSEPGIVVVRFPGGDWLAHQDYLCAQCAAANG